MPRKKPKGFTLLKPESTHGWRARWIDPDTGKRVQQVLPATLTTADLRIDWCHRKADEIQKRRFALDSGAVRKNATPLAEAVDRYFEARVTLRDTTLDWYRSAAKKLLAWAEREGLKTTDDLTRAKVTAFAESLVKVVKRTAAKDGKRGERRETSKRRSAVSVNRDLRSARTILGYLVDADLCAHLSMDDLRRALKRLPEEHEQAEFYKPAELAALMAACAAHDKSTFKMTRREKERGRAGKTPRYEPIGPFVRFVLLTGMRVSEAANVTWDRIDLEAGEIRLRAGDTKTKQGRTIDLAVAPTLLKLLGDMRKRRASGRVFDLTADDIKAAAKRLRSDKYKAPKSFTWQALRSTCATYLTNAPGIFGAASAYRSAKQLGHSVTVAEKHYLGVVKVPKDAATLELAMGIGP